MKKLIVSLSTLAAMAAHAADLRIEVSVSPQKQGTVLAAVFDKGEGFPRGKPVQTTTAMPVNGKAVIEFTGLPEGEYAVSAFLDENANLKLDSNLFGLPTEPYGFSRNARNLAGPPSFADAALRLGADSPAHSMELK